jgi:hypothetical protein
LEHARAAIALASPSLMKNVVPLRLARRGLGLKTQTSNAVAQKAKTLTDLVKYRSGLLKSV